MLIPRAGETLGEFELIRRIGAGGMGVVYEAHETGTRRRVALKILSPAMTRDKSRLRFLREAEAAARLHHPNIVAVYAIRQDADLCYYAMEYVDGWPLSRVLEQLGVTPPTRMPLSEIMRTHSGRTGSVDPSAETVVGETAAQRTNATGGRTGAAATNAPRGPSIIADASYVRQVARMIRDIARALHYAHGQGVTHRDVKPDNLLLDQQGNLHLVDFGLARILDEENLTMTGELMGTPLYMSPEQVAAGRIGMDHRTDIYSLGVVAYHLLCLQPPYEAPTREGLLRAIAIHAPPLLSARNPAVPRALESIVHHAMEKDPDRRYASGADMAEDLDCWLAGKAISLRTPGPLGRWWRTVPAERRRQWVGAAAAAVFLAAVLPTVGPMLRAPGPGGPPPPVAGPEQAFESARREANRADYLLGALWYVEALKRGGRLTGEEAVYAGLVLNELPSLSARFALAGASPLWAIHPSRSAVAFAEAGGRWRTSDLAGSVGASFGLGMAPAWIGWDPAGLNLLGFETGPTGGAAQLWTTEGSPVSSEPVSGLARVRQIRMTPNPTSGHWVVAFSKALNAASAPAGGRALREVDAYRLQPGSGPRLLRRTQTSDAAELSADGRFLATVNADDRLFLTNLVNGQTAPVGMAGMAAVFAFSPASQDLAIADSAGEITLFDAARGQPLPVQPMNQGGGLRARTAPAYMQFSPDGKWLLIVGTDVQVSPPNLRSIVLMSVRSAAKIYEAFGRDARFSDDGRILVTWDETGVVQVRCDTGEIVSRLAASIRSPLPPAEDMPQGDPTDAVHRPVWADARARRIVCIESQGTGQDGAALFQASVWDATAGEQLCRLLTPLPNLTAAGIDPTGRFAFAQAGTQGAELFAWDLGDPDAAYPAAGRLPLRAAAFEDLRLCGGPLLVVMTQVENRSEWLLIDPAALKVIGSPVPARGMITQWLISEDGRSLYEVSRGGMSRTLDLRTGEERHATTLSSAVVGVPALAPDGGRVALVWSDRRVLVRGTGPAEEDVAELGPLPDRPTRGRFSRGGAMIALADESGRVALYEVNAAGRKLADLSTGQPIRAMEFCLGDRLLVIGHTGGRASVWSVQGGECVGTAEPSSASPNVGGSAAAFSTLIAVRDEPAGGLPPLFAAACGNRIDLWPLPRASEPAQARALLPLGPPLASTQGLIAIAFPPCGPGAASMPATSPVAATQPTIVGSPCERLLGVTDRAAVRWFRIAIQASEDEGLRRAIRGRTGMELGPAGEPRFLPPPPAPVTRPAANG